MLASRRRAKRGAIARRSLWVALVVLCSTMCGGLATAADDESSAFEHGIWPFRPPVRPEVPAVADDAWVANPIDAFILASLESEGLRPNSAADRLTLLRRVTYDLTGLPPTVEEQAAFLADDTADAYAKVVDRLLDSPRYGERWAQHWLDLVRYAETNGFKADELRPLAHKYRDYCIRAFNSDLPYDRFIRQQFAGDELEPDNPWAIVATGLNRLYPDESNAADLRLRRQQILDDVTETTGLVFMGLTMGCASCHDHKFDDILQTDYYQLQAFFTPMLPRDDLPAATPHEREDHARRMAEWELATAGIRAEIESILAPVRDKAFRGVIQKYEPNIRQAILASDKTPYQMQLMAQAWYNIEPKVTTDLKNIRGESRERLNELERRLAEFDHLKPKALPRAMGIIDAAAEAPPTYVLATGNVYKPLEAVEPGFPAFLGGGDIAIEAAGEDGEVASTGRRTALANWLARDDHPLTSRVMVNRLWQHHFGEGIIASPNDFGVMGEVPSHPKLMDWLAVEFVEHGWSLKKLHRLMVLSNAYRQASSFDPENEAQAKALSTDPENKLLWRQRRRRLEGEAVRDGMLLVSRELSLRMYGPSAQPELPVAISRYAWKADERPADRNRRSIYVLAKRNMRYPMFEAFDQPDMHHSCGRRTTTTTALQSLLMVNGEFTFDRARAWSANLLAEHRDTRSLVSAAYQQAFGRAPEADELALAQDFLDHEARVVAGHAADESSNAVAPTGDWSPEQAAAVAAFCHALFNANEFLYVD